MENSKIYEEDRSDSDLSSHPTVIAYRLRVKKALSSNTSREWVKRIASLEAGADDAGMGEINRIKQQCSYNPERTVFPIGHCLTRHAAIEYYF